jgi:hypothetical protein
MLEQLLFLVVLFFVLAVSSMLVKVLKRQQRMASPEGEPKAPIVLPKAPLQPSLPVVSPSTLYMGPRLVPLSETPPGVTRRRARTRVGSLRDVRRGIVLMTILGPCRALESPRPPQ